MRNGMVAGLLGGALLLAGCAAPFAASATPTPVATATPYPYPDAERARFFAGCGDTAACRCAYAYLQAHYPYEQALALIEGGNLRRGQPEFDAIVKACQPAH